MMSEPRSLRLLRINDDLAPTASDMGVGADIHEDAPPEYIDVVNFTTTEYPGVTFVAIDGWERALHFWESFQPGYPPDLVVADVRFNNDDSSPLNYNGNHNNIPTGLTHLKPIAAMARSLGTPVGIGLHTGELVVGMWEDLANNKDRMGYFAAHEIAELAAILGDVVLLSQLSRPERLEWCWRWLRANTMFTFSPALGVALRNYRHQLIRLSRRSINQDTSPAIRVLPDSWNALVRWCNDMENGTPSETPPLSFLLPHGAYDSISLRSLFADCSTELDDLPADCFRIENSIADSAVLERTEPWRLDRHSRPQVGLFLYALGCNCLTEAADDAQKLLSSFPIPIPAGGPPTSLTKVDDKFVKGLAVLFQFIRIDHANLAEWRDVYASWPWIPQQLQTTSAITGTKVLPLCDWLRHVCNAVDNSESPVYLDDARELFNERFKDDFGEIDQHDFQWHLNLLVEANCIQQTTDENGDSYRVINRNVPLPPLPNVPPNGMQFVGANRVSYLRDSFGINKDDHNQLGLILNATFVHDASRKMGDRSRQGRLFFERFAAGHGLPWLIELMRQYAREVLAWTEEHTWPRCIRPRPDSD